MIHKLLCFKKKRMNKIEKKVLIKLDGHYSEYSLITFNFVIKQIAGPEKMLHLIFSQILKTLNTYKKNSTSGFS